MTRKELREPDAVEQVLSGWWVHLERYWKVVIAGTFGLLIAGGATSVYNSQVVSQEGEVADAMAAALYPLNAPLGDPDPSAPEYAKDFERFQDAEAAKAAGVERIQTFLTENADAALVPSIRVLKAAISSDPNAALTELEAGVAEGHTMRATSLMNLGRVQIAAGKRDEAAATYAKIAESSNGAIKALALMTLGDLQNPLVNDKGDAAKAREHYTKAKEALGPKPQADADDVFASFSEPYLYSELDNKLALLD